MDTGKIYLESVIKRFREYKESGDKAFAQLDEKEFHFIPAPGQNSLAIIITHMHGNMMSRWTGFLTEDGEKPWRNRDREFENGNLSSTELLNQWNEGWELVLSTLESLRPEDLIKTITIRSQPLPVIDAINRQLAHYSSHVGQIIYLAKWIRGNNWKTLSIPKGGSSAFNEEMKQSRH